MVSAADRVILRFLGQACRKFTDDFRYPKIGNVALRRAASLAWAGSVHAATAALLGVAFCFWLNDAAQGAPHQSSVADSHSLSFWRVPQRSGLHCLYVLLRLNGRRVTYADLLAAFPDWAAEETSLLQLRDIATDFGLNMAITRRRPCELGQGRLPLIVHLEDPVIGDGEFSLLLSYSKTKCQILAGKNMTIEDVSTDDFRRNWSGYALERCEISFRETCLVSMGVGACMLGLYCGRNGICAHLAARSVTNERAQRAHVLRN